MFEIIKQAFSSLKDSVFIFYILPLVISCCIGSYTYLVGNTINIFDGIVEPIGIFSALLFSVIFIVVEHYLKRKANIKSSNDEDKRYLENYQHFTREIMARIAFSIFLAGWIIILAFVFPQIKEDNLCWIIIRNMIFSFFLIQYVSLIIIVVKDMYAMLIEDTE